jgi:XapX domain-containing protein
MQAFILGGIVGGVFAIFRMPVPAPATLAGVLGILGLYAGYQLITRIV